MEKKSFRFNTSVLVDVNEESVTATAANGSSKIESRYLDNVHYISVYQRRISAFAIEVRMFVIGFIILFFTDSDWDAMMFKGGFFNVLCFWGGIGLMLLSVILFILDMLDGMMDLGLFDALIGRFFSDHGYKVTIGNRSGNNIVFLASDNELSRIQELEKLIYQVRDKAKSQPKPSAPSSNSLDSLEKLSELYKNGILTKEEFEKKKAQILGL
jgi:hypothetical protein